MAEQVVSKVVRVDLSKAGSVDTVSRRKRILNAIVIPFFVIYTLFTLFPFYVLFVRTFVGTKDAADLHLWIPNAEELSMDAEIGNLSIFYNVDIKDFKETMGIAPTEYLPARTKLAKISEEYDIPIERIKRYFAGFSTYNGWIVLFTDGQLWPAATRSVLVTLLSLMGINILSILTGYALAGLRRRYQMVVYNLFLLQMVIPPMLIILPQFLIVQWFVGLFPNTGETGLSRDIAQLLALILINIKGGALSTMLFTSAISAIPRELEESAMIDGSSRLQYFQHILLPLMKVPIASLTVIMLPGFWNQFLQPYVYLDMENSTLLPLIQNYSGQYTTNYQVVYTAIFVSVIPLLVLYVLFRRWFIQGVMAGAVKG